MRAALTFILFLLTVVLALFAAWQLFIVGDQTATAVGVFLTAASAVGFCWAREDLDPEEDW